jgi:esterase/lipase superfamily enzyme
VLSAGDAAKLLMMSVPVRISLYITEEWGRPGGDIVDLRAVWKSEWPPLIEQDGVWGAWRIDPAATPADFRTTHAVELIDYVASHDAFLFYNFWDPAKGKGGLCLMSREAYEQAVFEAWVRVGQWMRPPLRGQGDWSLLRWKSNLMTTGGERGGVHGVELVAPKTGDPGAWAFMVRREGFLDVDEFYVAPQYRSQFTQVLGEEVKRLSNKLGELRYWMPFADVTPQADGWASTAAASMGLYFDVPGASWAAYRGVTEEPSAKPPDPILPIRPAAIPENIRDGEADVDAQPTVETIWWASDRHLVDGQPIGGRADRVSYGICEVVIPKSHLFGSERPRWWKRVFASPAEPLSVRETRLLEADQFWSTLVESFNSAEQEEDGGASVIFIHGYNTGFRESAIRAAQLKVDLRVRGEMALFSWPSAGKTALYTADEAAIEASEQHIATFILDFAAKNAPRKTHVIAHSMGNRGLIRALQRIVTLVRDGEARNLGRFVLAAPDVDAALFKSLSHLYSEIGDSTTLYVSPRDLAVRSSAFVHRASRAGFSPPVVVCDGIDTVEVLTGDLLDLGHGYYAAAGPVLNDIYSFLWHGDRPSQRQRLREARTGQGEIYWKLTT